MPQKKTQRGECRFFLFLEGRERRLMALHCVFVLSDLLLLFFHVHRRKKRKRELREHRCPSVTTSHGLSCLKVH